MAKHDSSARRMNLREFCASEAQRIEQHRRDCVIQCAVDEVLDSDTWCAFRVMPPAPGHGPETRAFEQEATFSA